MAVSAGDASHVHPLYAATSGALDSRTTTARALAPQADAEAFPDALHDDQGDVFATGKIRVLKQSDSATGARPPVLASEVLREDLRPTEPGRATARWLGQLTGVLVLLLGGFALGWSVAGVVVMAFGAAQLAAALLPMSYARRATVHVGFATALLAGATIAKIVAHADPQPGLVLPVVVLATGLYFRAWHRASHVARGVVGVGMMLAAGWLGWSESMEVAVGSDGHWQAWLPGVVRLALAGVLFVAALAFMPETTTGGCHAWAALTLGWYATVAAVDAATVLWPIDAPTPTWSMSPGYLVAVMLGALAAPMLALGIAQLMVVASGGAKAATAQRPT